MLVKSFTVFHKDPEAREALGLGTVVGQVEQPTTTAYQSSIPRGVNGSPIQCLITETKIVLFYQVLWEGDKSVAPSLHKSTDLIWEDILDDVVNEVDNTEELARDVIQETLDEGLITSQQADELFNRFSVHLDNDNEIVDETFTGETIEGDSETIAMSETNLSHTDADSSLGDSLSLT